MGGEGDDRGWDSWMASQPQWTWVWVNSGIWWRARKPGVVQSVGSQRVRQDWATELNWECHSQLMLSRLWPPSWEARRSLILLRWKIGRKRRRKSNPFKVENRAEDKDLVVLLSLGALRSSGLVSGDSRTGSSSLWGYPQVTFKEMATHSSILAWKIPWTVEPVRLQPMGSQRVGHDWATSLHFTSLQVTFFLEWRMLPKEKAVRECCLGGVSIRCRVWS